MKIGFPIIEKEKKECQAVWISFGPDKDKKEVLWNGNSVSDQENLFKNYVVDNILHRITQYRSIHFESKCELTSIIEGPSCGLALLLASHYKLSNSDMPDVKLDILLTGAVHEDNENPLSLSDEDSLRLKGNFAVNNGYVLILHEKDYNMLDKNSGQKDGKSELPESVHELKKAMDEAKYGQGCAYILPVTKDGKWHSTDKDWFKGLGDFLGLESLISPESVNLEKTLSSNKADENETNEDHSEYQIEPGTIAELYQTALPSPYKSQYLSNFLEHNASICREKLFEDGLGIKALEDEIKKRLFFDRSKRREFKFNHILIGGPTGCGKTFLTEALMLNTALELGQPAIYIAPTRSLVYEVHGKLQKRFGFKDNNDFPIDKIVVSSGEESSDDWRIRDGNFNIALIVNEKANLFLNTDANLLNKVGLVIFDEVHMLSDKNRGSVLDMLVAKLRQEHESRLQKPHGMLLRIAFISTEDIINDNNISEIFTFKPMGGSVEIEPVKIFTELRPVPLKHRLQIYGRKGPTKKDEEDPIMELPIVDFCRQSDRNVRDDKLEKIRNQAESFCGKIYGKRSSHDKESDRKTPRILNKLIIKRSEKFKKIIVVGGSREGIIERAGYIANRRREKGDNYALSQEDMRQFEDFILGGSLAKSEGNRLKKAAEQRVYLHYGILPRNVREWVENRFRRRADEGGASEILFTTETLAFGVNLAADCIILLDIRFTRENPNPEKDEELIEEVLTPNQYHNILGRAGRFGVIEDNISALAEICIPADEKWLIDCILYPYYSDASNNTLAKEPLSNLLLYSDIFNMEKNRIATLDNISYPSFRSVMDALRHISEMGKRHVRANDIVSLFEYSIYWGTEYNLETAKGLIQKILELSAEYDKSDLSLVNVDKIGDIPAYKIQVQASALIDTGTRWQSIAPMQRWLDKITEIKDSGLQKPPPELLVPAFIASRDLWPKIKEFCWEGREYTQRSDSFVRENEEKARNFLIDELVKLKISNQDVKLVANQITEYVSELGSKLSVYIPEYCNAIFYKSIAAFLMWLRGEDHDSINQLAKKPRSDGKEDNNLSGRPFQQRYYEKASWLSVMCLRFFGESKAVLLPEHFRDLPHLSVRLRYGYPFEGLPFLQYRNSKAGLQRGEVQSLLNSGITASRIIKDGNPLNLISSLNALPDKIRKKAGLIVDDVFEFYWHQIHELKSGMKKPEMNNQWDSFISLMKKSFRKKDRGGLRKKGGELPEIRDEDIKELAKILYETFEIRRAVFPSEVKITMQNDYKTIRFYKEGKEDLLFYVAAPDEDTAQLQSGKYIIIKMPWRNEDTEQTNIELTALGAMVLAVLVGVEIIKFNSLFNCLHQIEPRTLSIKDIVKEFGEDPDFQAARDTKEAMLMFNEPGIDNI